MCCGISAVVLHCRMPGIDCRNTCRSSAKAHSGVVRDIPIFSCSSSSSSLSHHPSFLPSPISPLFSSSSFPLFLFFIHFSTLFHHSETGSNSTTQAGITLTNMAQADLELQSCLSQLPYCRDYTVEQPYLASRCILYYKNKKVQCRQKACFLSCSYLKVCVLSNSNLVS